jgi:hypothetical protein
MQYIEDRCLLLTSSISFVDLPFQEYQMMEKHHMNQNPWISSIRGIVTDSMTRGDDMAQSLGPSELKWGRPAPPRWPAGQVLAPFQFRLCQRVKEGRCMGYPMPKSVEAELGGRLAGQGLVSYRLKSTVELTHSTYKYPQTPFGKMEIKK